MGRNMGEWAVLVRLPEGELQFDKRGLATQNEALAHVKDAAEAKCTYMIVNIKRTVKVERVSKVKLTDA